MGSLPFRDIKTLSGYTPAQALSLNYYLWSNTVQIRAGLTNYSIQDYIYVSGMEGEG